MVVVVLVEDLEEEHEVALVALGAADEADAEQQQPGVDEHPEQQPGERQPDDVDLGQLGEDVEQQGQRADGEDEQPEDPHGQRELLAEQAAEVDAAERGLLVDVAGPGLRGVPAPGRAGDPDPGRRARCRS